MEAIILAGGLGTRLRHLVPDLPKPMAPIAGRPFLEILLASLAHKGFHRIVLSLGFMAEKVVGHFGDQFCGVELVYEIETHPLGTGGAIQRALRRCLEDHIYVLNGDTFLDVEISKMEVQWQAEQAPIIVARSVPDTSRYGCIHAAGGRVLDFREKGSVGPGLINAGFYVLPKNVLNSSPYGRTFSFETDFLATQVTKSRFDLFVADGYFIDIGVPEDYLRAQIELAGLWT